MATNISLYTLPAAWITALVPHHYAIFLSKTKKELPGFRNVSPRDFVAAVRDAKPQTPVHGQYLRAEAASANGFENLALFTVAVIAGNAGGLPVDTLNKLSVGYIVSRWLYNYLYVAGTRESTSLLRTGAYTGGIVMIYTLLIKGGFGLASFTNPK